MPTKLLSRLQAARYLGIKTKDFLALVEERPPTHFEVRGQWMFAAADLDAWIDSMKVPGVNSSAAGRVKAPQQPEPGEPAGAPRTALEDPVAERERLRRLGLPGGDRQAPIPEDRPFCRPIGPDAPDPYRGMSPRQIAGCGLPGDE